MTEGGECMNAKPEKDHLDDAFWDTGATRFSTKDGTMTMREAGRIFRLVPEPPAVAAINDYNSTPSQSSSNSSRVSRKYLLASADLSFRSPSTSSAS